MRIALTAIVALSLSGCGTICNFANAPFPIEGFPERPAVYGGLQFDAAVAGGFAAGAFQSQSGDREKAMLILLGILVVDLPLSFVGDTLTLPVTLLLERARNPRDSSPEPRLDSPGAAMQEILDNLHVAKER